MGDSSSGNFEKDMVPFDLVGDRGERGEFGELCESSSPKATAFLSVLMDL